LILCASFKGQLTWGSTMVLIFLWLLLAKLPRCLWYSFSSSCRLFGWWKVEEAERAHAGPAFFTCADAVSLKGWNFFGIEVSQWHFFRGVSSWFIFWSWNGTIFIWTVMFIFIIISYKFYIITYYYSSFLTVFLN